MPATISDDAAGSVAVRRTEQNSDDVANPSQSEWKMSRPRIIKNHIVVCFGIFFYMSAINPSQELQTSINIKDGIGALSGSIGGYVNLVSQLLLPSFMIRRFGLKRTIFYSMLIGSITFAGNFWPKLWTLTLSSIITGIGTTPKWTAKSAYINIMAERYSENFGHSVTSKFFGVFYAFYYFGYIGGNLFSVFVLHRSSIRNSTEVPRCGLDFCDWEAIKYNPNFISPDKTQIYILFGTFTAMTLVAAFMIKFLLDDVPSRTDGKRRLMGFLDSILHLRKKNQLLLLPICFFRGHFKSMLVSEISKAYVTCLWGVDRIGLVNLCYGVCCGLCSPLLGVVVRWTGRPVLFALAAICNLGILLTLLFWTPQFQEFHVLIILAAIWGTCFAVWESQLASLVGVLFPRSAEAAFNNYVVFEDLGSTVALTYSAYVCFLPKVYISASLLILAVLCYIILEITVLRTIKEVPSQTTENTEAIFGSQNSTKL